MVLSPKSPILVIAAALIVLPLKKFPVQDLKYFLVLSFSFGEMGSGQSVGTPAS